MCLFKLSKEAIIVKIKSYFEQKIAAQAAAVENVITTTELAVEPEKKAKKTKLKKSVKMSADTIAQQNEAAECHSDEPPAKTKKKPKKEEQPLCVKCATPKASAKKKKVKKMKIELSFSQPKKSTNRVRRNLNAEATAVEAQPLEENNETNKSIEAKKKKKIKKQVSKNKIRKSSNSESQVNIDAQPEIEHPIIEAAPKEQIEKEVQQQNEQVERQESLSVEQLTFNRKSQRLSNITNNLTNYNRTSVANESSLLTNDNASTNEQDNANITKDILNTTFDKSTSNNPASTENVSKHFANSN